LTFSHHARDEGCERLIRAVTANTIFTEKTRKPLGWSGEMGRIGMVMILGLAVAGCSAPTEPTPSMAAHGRYVGIGVYQAGALWAKMALSGAAKDPSRATTQDDEHIIVVVDSQTGEVRECGDYSGLCASLSPWTQAIATPQKAPVTLTKHLADLAGEQTAAPPPKTP